MSALALAATLTATLVGTAPGVAVAKPDNPFPTVMSLPDGWQPEGITIGSGKRAWLGSRADGSIYELDLKTGEGRSSARGRVRPRSDSRSTDATGCSWPGARRQRAGRRHRDGQRLATYQLTTGASFINDVLLHRKAAWFTDSQKAQLYKLPLGEPGALPRRRGGDAAADGRLGAAPRLQRQRHLPYAEPPGAARRELRAGALYRVDPETGAATVVDLGGTSLTNGDGLLLKGTTLFVVQNQLNRVAVLKLNADGTAGTLKRTITSPDFDVPTTVARFGSRLYLPNARFTTPPTPTTTYTVVQVPANAR